jgi:DNA-binding transcriptional ArsR family regulator
MPRSSLVSRRTLGAKSASNRSRKPSDKIADFRLSAKRAGQASAFLKALAHESRLLILCLLCEGEKTVTDLEELLSLRQASVSQHLARLRFDGLVQAKRNGKAIHYSLANDDVHAILGTLHGIFCKRPKRPAR